MIRVHGVIGGPKPKKTRSSKTKHKPKANVSVNNRNKSIDKINVIVVSSIDDEIIRESFDKKIKFKEEAEIIEVAKIVEVVEVAEIDYENIKDNGPDSVEDKIYKSFMIKTKKKYKRKKRKLL